MPVHPHPPRSFGFLFLGFGLPFFSHLVGFLYPAYASFKAVEARPSVAAPATSSREEVQVGGVPAECQAAPSMGLLRVCVASAV